MTQPRTDTEEEDDEGRTTVMPMSSMAASAVRSSTMMSQSRTDSEEDGEGRTSMTGAVSSALPQQTTNAAAGNFINGALIAVMGPLAL
jgi:hypothetical protein